jgi:hypothetical protein
MFEALRGLRDAVAPESGNLGNTSNNTDNTEGAATEPDVEELWQAYCNGDEAAIALVNKFSTTTTGAKVIQKRDDFMAWHAVMEREKDAELVETLAAAVLEKSDQIDAALLNVPGMHRKREQQMKYIQELIVANSAAAEELETVYKIAVSRRDECRQFVRDTTSVALGIEEED